MIKTKLFRVGVHLSKLEAKCNKVQCSAHAVARIQQSSLEFKETPQLKKNSAIFNSTVQFDCIKLMYNSMQGFYQDKNLVIIIELITQGVTVKIGQSHINIAKILNAKKFSIPTTYPLVKCYDKAANIKVSIQFDPVGQNFKKSYTTSKQLQQNIVLRSEMYEQQQYQQRSQLHVSQGEDKNRQMRQKQKVDINWTKNRFKSRLAQQQNVLLHSKIQQYEDKMEKLRINSQSMAQKLHEQIWKKDERILQLQAINKKQTVKCSKNQGQLEQIKVLYTQLCERDQKLKDKYTKSEKLTDQLKQQNNILKKQVQSLKIQVQNFQKNKDTKDRHYKQQLQKYSNKFMTSQHQKNLVILEMQSRLKQQKQKYDKINKQLMKNNQIRLSQINSAHRQKYSKIQSEMEQLSMIYEQLKRDYQKSQHQNKRLKQIIDLKQQQSSNIKNQFCSLQKKYDSAMQQLQLIPHTTAQRDAEARKLRQQIRDKKDKIQQLRTQITLANNTINQSSRKTSKLKGQIQSAKYREKQLIEMYQQQLELKQVDTQILKQNNQSWLTEVNRLKGKLKLAQERVSEFERKVSQKQQNIHNLKMEIQKKKQNQLHISQQNIMIQSQNSHLKRQINEAEQIIKEIKEQNQHLNRFLAYKNSVPIQNLDQTDKWGQRVDTLQKDISVMMEKYKNQKHQIYLQHQQQLAKMRQQSQKRIRAIQNQMHELRIKKNDLTTLNSQLKNEINNLNDKSSSKSQQLTKIQTLNGQLQAERQKLKSTVESERGRIKEMELKIQDLEGKLSNQKIRIKNLKNTFTKYLMSLMDKLTSNNNIQTFNQQQTILQQQFDRQVINYVNLGIRKYFDIKVEIQNKMLRLQQQYTQNLNLIDKLKQEQFQQKKKVQQVYEKKQQIHVRIPSNTCNIIDHLQLSERYDQYRYQYDSLTKQFIELKSKIMFFNEEAQKYKDLYEQINQKFYKQKRQLQQANEDLNISNTNLKNSRQEVIKLTNDLREIQRKLQALEDHKKREKFQSSDKKQKSQIAYLQRALAQSQTKYAEINVQLQQSYKIINFQKQKNLNQNKKIFNLQSIIKEKDLKIFTLNQNIRFSQTQIDQLEIKIKQMNKENKVLNKQTLVQIEQQKSLNESLKEEKKSLEKQIVQLIKKNQSLNDSLKQYQSQHKKIVQEKQKYIQQILMKDQTKQLEHQAAIQNWKENLVQQDKKRRNAQIQLQKSKTQIKNLNKKCQDLSREINQEKNEVQAQKQSRNRQKAHFESYIQNLKMTINQKESEKEQIKFLLQAKIMALQQKQGQKSGNFKFSPLK